MLGMSFVRARRYARQFPAALAAVYLSSATLGLGLLLLIGSLGLLTHVALVDPAGPGGVAASTPWGWGLVQAWLPDSPAAEGAAGALLVQRRRLLVVLALGLFAALVYAAGGFCHEWAVARLVERVATRLRSDLARQALALGAPDLLGRHQLGIGELFVETVNTLREGLAAWWRAVPPFLAQVPLLILAGFVLQFWTALAGVLIICLDWVALQWLFRRIRQRQSLLADRARRQQDGLCDSLDQTRLAANLQLPDVPGEPLGRRLENLRLTLESERAAEATFTLWLRIGVLATTLVLLGLIGLNVLSSPPRCSLPTAAMLTALLLSSYQPVTAILAQRGPTLRADRAARALFGFLDGPGGVSEAPGALRLRPLVEQIELGGVTVIDRAGRRLLDDVSLRLPARGRVALLATDDATPLALVGLLARFYDPSAGRVLIDGRDLRQVSLDSLRGQVGLVLETGLLFSGTVAENLALGGEYTTQQITDACRLAQVYPLVQRLPQGLATVVGRDGVRLDPGEVLQLGLARMLIRDPRLVVIEESRAEPDSQVAEQLEALMARWGQQRLLVVLARRLSTLRHADRVMLFHEGRLAATGSHGELLRQNELYRHLHYVRFNEFRQLQG